MVPEIERHRENIAALCRTFHVRRLDVFGSATTGAFTAESDFDFLVEFEHVAEIGGLKQYFGFKDSLEALLGRDVDLVEASAIRNPYFRDSVERTKALLYAA